MRICFYCDSIFSFGGVQRVLSVIAKELSQRYEVTIVTHDDPSMKDISMYDLQESEIEYQFINYPDSPFYEYLPSKFYSLLYKKILPQNNFFSNFYRYSSFPRRKRLYLIHLLNKGEYDVIVGVHAFLSLYLANIKDSLNGIVIGWMHSSYDAFFQIKSPYLKDLKQYFSFMIPRLDQIIVLSFYDQRRYLNDLKFKRHPNVIYNPITIKSDFKEYENNKTFLAVGRFSHKTKGFDILIKAFALFAKRNQVWKLDIVGDGPEKNYLLSLIAKYELESRINLHPFTKKVEDYFKKAGVYVLSSRWEGFGLVLLEAMSYGLPIISSDIPVAEELLKDQGCAILFKNESILDLCEKMEEIANKEIEELNNMSEISLNYVNEFSVNKIVMQWETLLSNL